MDAEAGSKLPVDSFPCQRDSAGFGELLQCLGAPEVCRLHGAADGFGSELTWTSALAVGGKTIIFVTLQMLGVYFVCSNEGPSEVQGIRIYSSALKRQCSHTQSRAALAEGLSAL